MFDDEEPEKPRGHVVGMPIDTLSVDELRTRVGQLEAEIGRLRQALEAREETKAAADSFFKR